MACGLHESSGQDLNTFLDGSSGMASDQPSGAAAAAPPAHNQAEEDKPEQPGEDEYSGVGEWNQAEQERIIKQICPEFAILKNGERIQAPWHRFIPYHRNLGPHWVCELCVVKSGKKRHATEEHLGSTEHINRIGKGDPRTAAT